jgi:hypothetical protein
LTTLRLPAEAGLKADLKCPVWTEVGSAEGIAEIVSEAPAGGVHQRDAEIEIAAAATEQP